jgi:BMFP domain-containing protein YqiC
LRPPSGFSAPETGATGAKLRRPGCKARNCSEKNVRAGLGTVFNRLDLVTREEFEAQGDLLIRTREKLSELEARIAELEKQLRAE